MNVPQRAAVYVFLLLTAAVFLGPAAAGSVPHPGQVGVALAQEGFSLALVVVQVAVLLVVNLTLLRTRRPARFPSRTGGGILLASALALANAARLATGVRWPGFAADLLGAVWFAGPLGILAIALWPRDPQPAPWWAGPWKALLIAFPLIFLLAGLARMDLRTPFGAVPLPLLWTLAYGPTLIAVSLALAGWIFGAVTLHSPRRAVGEAGVLALGAAGVALLVWRSPLTAFVLSATITWGSGYQLFTAPAPLPPLIVSLTLAGVAFLAFVVTLANLRRAGKPTLGPGLVLAAVLSGIFPTPLSVLGALAALLLAWWTTVSIHSAGERSRSGAPLPVASHDNDHGDAGQHGDDGQDHGEDVKVGRDLGLR